MNSVKNYFRAFGPLTLQFLKDLVNRFRQATSDENSYTYLIQRLPVSAERKCSIGTGNNWTLTPFFGFVSVFSCIYIRWAFYCSKFPYLLLYHNLWALLVIPNQRFISKRYYGASTVHTKEKSWKSFQTVAGVQVYVCKQNYCPGPQLLVFVFLSVWK